MGNKSGALAVTVIALLAAACSPKDDRNGQQASVTPTNVTLTAEQRRHIRFYTVASSRFHKATDTTGTVDFDNDQATSVIAPMSGPVTRLMVSPGDHVGKGQPLAAVASSDYAAAVSAYQKAVATAANARRIADADKDLVLHQSVSQREADQAQTDAANAEADRDAALQGLTALNIDDATIREIRAGKPVARVEGLIRSPLAGTVVERLVTPGQLLQAGTTASFTVADLSRVWVMAQIFDSDINTVNVGDTARVTAGSGTFSGTVTNIIPQVDADTRSMKVRVAVANPAGLLKRQMYVHVLIQSRLQSTGILVPDSAVLRDDENLPFVYVTQRDGSFARRHVTLGERVGDRYQIRDGLHAGDQIAVDGALFVQFLQNQ
ncbi:MAG TPA: efflux RND transporter periplasmic adaptor subunit [Rhizomicrobium sp.]|nr:efflux RND transporter periplasmic adaptor subunit [Rhizomicrobium sp.]